MQLQPTEIGAHLYDEGEDQLRADLAVLDATRNEARLN